VRPGGARGHPRARAGEALLLDKMSILRVEQHLF
jgi:hypothetical protein